MNDNNTMNTALQQPSFASHDSSLQPSVASTTRRKLRSSCNACGTAKVKCDRRHPRCDRCIAMGLVCVYGLSRKVGKSPRKRLVTVVGKSTPLHEQHNPTLNLRHNSESGEFFDTSVNQIQSQNLSLQEQFGFSDMLTGTYTTLGIDEQSAVNSSFFPRFSLNNGTRSEDIADFTPITAVIPEDLNLSLAPTSSQSESIRHECPQQAIKVLTDLNSPHPFLAIDARNILKQLDFVLHSNRAAIEHLGGLLNCSCSKSSHLVMLHASIISRILLWYQQAAGLRKNETTGSLSKPTAPSEVTDANPAPQLSKACPFTCAESATELPFSLGTFNIEEPCVHFAVRMTLIGSELKSMGKLIDQFQSEGTQEETDQSIIGLRSSLGSWLQTQHSNTFKLILKAHKEITESIASCHIEM